MSNFEARLRERDEDRKAAAEKRRVHREEGQRVEESSGYVAQQFAQKKTAILKLLESSERLPCAQLPAHFDGLSLECQALQKYVSDSVIFLTAYTLQSYQQQITQLHQEINTKQDKLIPKKKFAFKSRKKEDPNSAAQSTKVKTKDAESATTDVVAALASQSLVGFNNRSHEKLEMNDGEMRSHDINLAKLSHCEVRLCGAPSTLHMSTLDNCTILCGPVSSSVFVENCRDCTFVVACQQLRVHTTTQSQFYVHVTSRSIIEDCSSVTFAPYSWSYLELPDHYQVSGLDRGSNNWNKVDDFNWLASSDPSPNWSTLPEQDRTTFT